jgi:hypothetical protein
MRRTITVIAMFIVSYVLAAIITPPDPYWMYLTSGVIFLVAIVCYVLGLREGRANACTSARSTEPDGDLAHDSHH